MKLPFVCALLLCCPLASRATVTLPDLFTDHAVLQKNGSVSVWGTAASGEAVTVTPGTAPARQTTADGQGKWRVELDLTQAPSNPFDLTVKGAGNTLVIHDVVVGEVWICSGQSNMEFKLAHTIGGSEEIARSADPMLRYFVSRRQAVATPAANLGGHWVVAGPKSSGEFSGVAYYFAKEVEAVLHTPVGLIDTSWGGTPAEAWISAAGLDRDPALKARKDAVLAGGPAADQLKRFGEEYNRWAAKYQREVGRPDDPGAFADPGVSTADWKTVRLPGELGKQGLPDAGVVWLRREVEIPAGRANAAQPLLLGTPHDFETVFWNGKRVGETTAGTTTSFNPDLIPTTNRRYEVPADLLHPGRNTLAIRLVSPAGGAGLQADRFFVAWDIPLAGEWQAKVEREFPPLPADAVASYPRRPPFPINANYTATYLFNGMVQPLTMFTVRGVLWYQGEANAGRAHQYRTTFPLLIQDWREHFHREDLPFYFCQLANNGTKRAQPGESGWAELREAQAETLSLPHTGMAVLIDLGEEDDIHFRDKKDAGERLAAVVLAKTYGKTIPAAGPTFRNADIRNGEVIIHFADADGGLEARALPATYQPKSSLPATKPLVRYSPDSELQGFAVCGDDGHWKWANAKIVGDAVVVSSPDVPNPKFVRYAWADNPTCNLYNKAGFPAAPFRTDHFPDSTAKNLY